MQELSIAQALSIYALPVLFAVTLHEVAHGRVALWLGDSTAFARGRLSLNPLRHIDPVGTVLVPALLLSVGGVLFGWARPVPVNAARLRRPQRDMALVALAGPVANVLMAGFWALVASVASSSRWGTAAPWLGEPLLYMGLAGITVNILLMVLNLLPIPPLDGSRVLAGILPPGLARGLYRLEPFGLIVLLALLLSGVLTNLLETPVHYLQLLFFCGFNDAAFCAGG